MADFITSVNNSISNLTRTKNTLSTNQSDINGDWTGPANNKFKSNYTTEDSNLAKILSDLETLKTAGPIIQRIEAIDAKKTSVDPEDTESINSMINERNEELKKVQTIFEKITGIKLDSPIVTDEEVYIDSIINSRGVVEVYDYNMRLYDNPYGSSGTIHYQGCGPTSAAIVLRTLLDDPTITPVSMAEDALHPKGLPGTKYENPDPYRVVGSGTYSSFFGYEATKYGLDYKDVAGSSNLAKDLDDNNMIIVHVTGGHTDQVPFGAKTSGHYVVLYKNSDTGKYAVVDPYEKHGGAYNDDPIEPEELKKYSNYIDHYTIIYNPDNITGFKNEEHEETYGTRPKG